MRKHVRWLYEELPRLVAEGILPADAAERLRAHYGEADDSSKGQLALVLFGILGSLLVGAGIILLLAHNWETLSRRARTIIALTPVAAGQALALWGVATGRRSVAWREAVATLITLGIGAGIALVGQTYHIPGDLAAFLMTWMLLALPLVYLLEASAPAIIYLAGLTAWAVNVQGVGGHAVWFWPLAALVLPHLWISLRENRFSVRSGVLGWAIGLSLCVATGITLEKALPGLWIVVYAALLAVLYLAGRWWHSNAPSLFQQPFSVIGALGVPILALIVTWAWPWRQIGRQYYRTTAPYHENAAWFDYIAAVVLFTTAIVLLVREAKGGKWRAALFGAAPAVAALAYAAAAQGTTLPAMLLFNAYVLTLGIATLVSGIRSGRLATVNGGMLITTALILSRFFDSDFDLVVRAAAFILLGVGFFATNLILIRRT